MSMSEQSPRSDRFGLTGPGRRTGANTLVPSGLSRYDFLLAFIPLVLLFAWLFGRIVGVPLWTAMAAGGLLSVPLVVDGLAINPPS